jgi:hypothetical protein
MIAIPNVDNANRIQKKGKKLNYKLHVILMQNGIVFIFANYLDNVLVWNYAMSGFKRRIEMAGMGFAPTCIHVLNSLKFRLLPNRQAVALRKCQLAGHKRQVQKTGMRPSVFNLQKFPLGSANMVAKKKVKKEKKKFGKTH